MISVYDYSDYRAFLTDALQDKKKGNAGFSHRAAAQRIGIGSGTLTRILKGSRGIGAKLLPAVISFLGLRSQEADYFTLLVHYDKASHEADRRHIYQEIIQLRAKRRRIVSADHYQLFARWYYPAILQIIRIRPGISDPLTIGSLLSPAISAAKCRKALTVLEQCGFIRRQDDEGFFVTDQSITTGERWAGTAIHDYQATMADMGRQAIDTVDQSLRDISTLTLSLSHDSFKAAKDILKKARQEILALEEQDRTPQRAWQLNLQFFPLSEDCGTGEENDHVS